MKIKILLADDHKLVLEGLRRLLLDCPDISIAGVAENGRDAVQQALHLKPDIVILDATMSEMSGIEATRRIVAENGKIKVLALSLYTDRQIVMQMVGAGVSGFLPKDSPPEDLIAALHAIMTNQFYISPRIAGVLIEDYREHLHPSAAAASPLTSRERESLQLLAEGKSTKEIASTLNVSEKTIETYRHQIMKKLKLHSVAQLTSTPSAKA